MPGLYVITGSNGAGKSSFGHSYLPKYLKDNYPIFDGDKLYLIKKREVYPARTPSMKEAARIANARVSDLFEKQVCGAITKSRSFIYEGHFREDDSWLTPERFKKAGYTINFIFLGLADTQQAALRVFERAKQGGHDVPPHEIEKNFFGNLYQVNRRSGFIDYLKTLAF
jgi:predicted ABC-type ATPase